MDVKINIFPMEDGGLIGPIKYRPHLEKGKSGEHVVRAWEKGILSQ
jgi:hypothetical protein